MTDDAMASMRMDSASPDATIAKFHTHAAGPCALRQAGPLTGPARRRAWSLGGSCAMSVKSGRSGRWQKGPAVGCRSRPTSGSMGVTT